MSIFHSGNPAACERDPNGCSNSERLLNLVDTHSSGCVRYAAASLPATVRSTLALSVSDVQAILDSYSGPAQHAFVCTLMPAIDFAGAQCTVELLGTLARAAESLNNWSRKALEAECFPVFDPKYFQEAVWSEVIRPYLKRASNEDLPTLDVAELVDRTLDLLRDRPQNPTQLLRLPLRALIEVLPTNDGDLLSKYTAFGGAVLDLQNNAVQSSFGSVRHEFRLRDVIRYAEPPLTLLELNNLSCELYKIDSLFGDNSAYIPRLSRLCVQLDGLLTSNRLAEIRDRLAAALQIGQLAGWQGRVYLERALPRAIHHARRAHELTPHSFSHLHNHVLNRFCVGDDNYGRHYLVNRLCTT